MRSILEVDSEQLLYFKNSEERRDPLSNTASASVSENPLGSAPVGKLIAKFAIPAIISMLVVMFILPSMFMLFDKLICKTSKGFINKDGNGNTGGKGAIPPIMDTAE